MPWPQETAHRPREQRSLVRMLRIKQVYGTPHVSRLPTRHEGDIIQPLAIHVDHGSNTEVMLI